MDNVGIQEVRGLMTKHGFNEAAMKLESRIIDHNLPDILNAWRAFDRAR